MKNKKLLIFLTTFLVVLLLASSPILASDSDNGVIRVFGDALVTVAPDQCIIILGVETIGADAAVAVVENAEIMNRVIAALKNLNLRDDQVRTGIFSLHPQTNFSWHMDVTREEPQYRVYNSISITLDNLEMIGQVIDTAISSGANQVQSVQFGVRDTETVMLQALRAATLQARVKADVIAGAANVEIVGIRSIQEDWGSFSPSMSMFNAEVAMLDAASGFRAATPIIPSDVQINARVTIEYNIR